MPRFVPADSSRKPTSEDMSTFIVVTTERSSDSKLGVTSSFSPDLTMSVWLEPEVEPPEAVVEPMLLT